MDRMTARTTNLLISSNVLYVHLVKKIITIRLTVTRLGVELMIF